MKMLFMRAILMVILMSASAFAQEIRSFKDPLTVRFEHLTYENGLSGDFAAYILQDRKGFIWIGMKNGLNRYDGSDVAIYTHDPENPQSLSNNYAWWLFEDRSGTLWIGTWGGGLNRFDSKTETFVRYQHDETNPKSLGGNLVWGIYEDRAGVLWVGTDGGGLNRFEPEAETFVRYQYDKTNPDSISHNTVTQLYEDAEGALWVCTYGGGLNKLDPDRQKFVRYQHQDDNPDSLGSDFIWAIHGGDSGMLWIGTEYGLDRFDPKTGKFTHFRNDKADPNSISHNTVLTLHKDRKGVLWVGTYGGGLNMLDSENNRFIRYQDDARNPNSLSDNVVWDINEDNTGAIWIATSNGVNRYDPESERFALWRNNPMNPNSISDSQVSAIYEDSDGVLWVGTKGGGLNRMDLKANTCTRYRHDENRPDSLSSDNVLAIRSDKRGGLWLGTEGGGLNWFDPVSERFTRYQHDPNNSNSLNNDSIWDIDVDSDGTVWIGMVGGGMDRFDPETRSFIHYVHDDNNPNSLASDWVISVFADSKNRIWVGAEGGLSLFDPAAQTFTNFQPKPGNPDSLSNNTVNTVYEDHQGLFWIGTNDGLNRLDLNTKKFTVWRDKHGLAGNRVNGILEDGQGNLWISTDRGLSKFDPHRQTFRNYDKRDGLQSNLFYLHSAFKSRDGNLFFGGDSGLNAFHPDNLTDNTYIPPTVLTDFQIFNQPVRIGRGSPLQDHIIYAEQIVLDYTQSVFSFKFAALNYRSPGKNRYAYRMEGFDKDWTYTDSSRRFAAYTNLDPGEYTFRVKASNNDGVWNEQGTSVKLIITPPWWKTVWFRISLAILIICLSFGGFRWRIRSIRAQNRRLEQLVTERTAALTESNHQLEIATYHAEQAREKADAANRAKSTFLANMNHELRSPLNAIIGFAQILSRSRHLPADLQENVSIINRSGEHLLTLINQVLDLSKIEAGRMTLYESSFDLHCLLDEIEDIFLLRAEDKNLSLVFERFPDTPRYVKTDEVKLRQVLINLLNNAIKFTSEGGITVRVKLAPCATSHLQTEADKEDEFLVLHFEVEDTGPGIAANEMDCLFEAFVQTQTGRQSQEGTGLGLPICRKFVQLMGGDIAVSSELGKGSIFKFNIRVRSATEADIKTKPPSRRVIALAPGQPVFRILIVDDRLDNRRLLIKLLNPIGFELREAENGKQAIEIWEEWAPHLIWMDMRMPVMNGYEATTIIKQTTKGQATVVIALTASVFEEERSVVLSAGCDDFLRKPFKESEIFDLMNKHIGVRYVYEEESPKEASDRQLDKKDLTYEMLTELTEEWRTALYQAANQADAEMIFSLLEQIQEDHALIAGALKGLVDEFQYDRIMEVSRGQK